MGCVAGKVEPRLKRREGELYKENCLRSEFCFQSEIPGICPLVFTLFFLTLGSLPKTCQGLPSVLRIKSFMDLQEPA